MTAPACSICGGPAASRAVTVRSGREMTLWHCAPCELDFFAHDPTSSLEANKLDESRLKAAGLDIPARDHDFANGTAQARGYVDEYIDASDAGRAVLEIGCSWGYFLKLAQDAGMKPFGVELNAIRRQYVNDELHIPCDGTLDVCEARNIRFRKIFLFYVLEYVPDPRAYLTRLVRMLEEGGSLVVITPNLADPLKDLWRNAAFGRFFYDEHAINYMTPRSVNRMLTGLPARSVDVVTRQGYSFVNHVSWFLTNGPRATGVVGGDNFVRDILSLLRPDARVPEWDESERGVAGDLAAVMERFDAEYRRVLEERGHGNQIRFVARK